jgi:L-lactate dehydrogenase complex protein LldG
MSSRDTILGAIKAIDMDSVAMPVLPVFEIWFDSPVAKFKEVATAIGAQIYEADNMESVPLLIQNNFDLQGRIISNLMELGTIAEILSTQLVPQSLEDVEWAILKGDFGVAENGAIWFPESMMGIRVLPFICQQLILIVQKKDIVPMMSHAYERIGASDYPYGTFIAGPSKTADIEQSLVLGAHGARSLGIILI